MKTSTLCCILFVVLAMPAITARMQAHELRPARTWCSGDAAPIGRHNVPTVVDFFFSICPK